MGTIKTKEQIELMRAAGRVWASVMDLLAENVRPGVSLKDLDEIARGSIEKAGMHPSFLGYKPAWANESYPASICTSVNDVVVHGVPDDYELSDGDLLSIDMGVENQGWHCDAARSFAVGNVDKKIHNLMNVTRLALDAGIAAAKPGNRLGDIGHAIESVILEHGMYVVDSLTGHGIGNKLHEEPTVFNFGDAGTGAELVAGICLAIEPMVAIGTGKIVERRDGAFLTKDGSLAAHFEDTIVITPSGAEVITASSL